MPPFPNLIDLVFKPIQDFARFRLIFQGIDGDLSRMHRNQLSLCLEGYRRGVFYELVTTQLGIQVREHIANVFIEMSNAVQRLKTWITLRPKDFLLVSFE